MPVSKKSTKQKQASPTLAEQVEQAIKLLDQVASMVEVSKSSLTKADRAKAVKMKAGGAKFVPVIATLAKRFGVVIGGHPVSTMMGTLQQVQDLMPLLTRAQLLVTQLSDASLHGNAQVWDSATVLYGTLKRVSHRSADVQATLAPVQEFFGRRKATASTKETATTEATPTAAAPIAPPATPAAHATT